MKRILWLSILAGLIHICLIAQNKEVTITGDNSTELRTAIKALENAGVIHVVGTIQVLNAITIPQGILLKVENSGSFHIKTEASLTIEGAIEAGSYRIFNKAVSFSKSPLLEIPTEWFGTGDIAVNKALQSADRIPVKISSDQLIANTIYMNSYQTLLISDSATLRTTNQMKGKAVITNKNETDTHITLNGGTIDGSEADKVRYEAVLFNNVTYSVIKNLSCLNVHITASRDTGNIRLNNCNNVLIENCNVTGTWKMGIFILNGFYNKVVGGKFYGTHDSAIGVVGCTGTVVEGLFVDNCGTSDASNMSLNSERMIITNNTSINASGTRNGNGITLGHNGSPASYSICQNNTIKNNNAKGIFIQGTETKNVLVCENTIISNGINSNGTNSGGIAVYSNTKNHLISDNTILKNRLGISLHNTSENVTIYNNRIMASTLYGIRNDGKKIKIEANFLSNIQNIHNGSHSEDLTFTNNITTTVDRN